MASMAKSSSLAEPSARRLTWTRSAVAAGGLQRIGGLDVAVVRRCGAPARGGHSLGFLLLRAAGRRMAVLASRQTFRSALDVSSENVRAFGHLNANLQHPTGIPGRGGKFLDLRNQNGVTIEDVLPNRILAGCGHLDRHILQRRASIRAALIVARHARAVPQWR